MGSVRVVSHVLGVLLVVVVCVWGVSEQTDAEKALHGKVVVPVPDLGEKEYVLLDTPKPVRSEDKYQAVASVHQADGAPVEAVFLGCSLALRVADLHKGANELDIALYGSKSTQPDHHHVLVVEPETEPEPERVVLIGTLYEHHVTQVFSADGKVIHNWKLFPQQQTLVFPVSECDGKDCLVIVLEDGAPTESHHWVPLHLPEDVLQRILEAKLRLGRDAPLRFPPPPDPPYPASPSPSYTPSPSPPNPCLHVHCQEGYGCEGGVCRPSPIGPFACLTKNCPEGEECKLVEGRYPVCESISAPLNVSSNATRHNVTSPHPTPSPWVDPSLVESKLILALDRYYPSLEAIQKAARLVFEFMDWDGDGKVNVYEAQGGARELKALAEAAGNPSTLPGGKMSLVTLYGHEFDGGLFKEDKQTFEDMLHWLAHKKFYEFVIAPEYEALREKFKEADTNHDAWIDINEAPALFVLVFPQSHITGWKVFALYSFLNTDSHSRHMTFWMLAPYQHADADLLLRTCLYDIHSDHVHFERCHAGVFHAFDSSLDKDSWRLTFDQLEKVMEIVAPGNTSWRDVAWDEDKDSMVHYTAWRAIMDAHDWFL